MLEFDWDAANIGHIAKHRVTVAEAEFVLRGPTLDYGYQDHNGEERYAEVGGTAHGRILMVITTWRGTKIRVVTAFDAEKNAKDEYLKTR